MKCVERKHYVVSLYILGFVVVMGAVCVDRIYAQRPDAERAPSAVGQLSDQSVKHETKKPEVPSNQNRICAPSGKKMDVPGKPKKVTAKDLTSFGFTVVTNGVYFKEKVELSKLAGLLGFEMGSIRETVAASGDESGQAWVPTGSGKCILHYVAFKDSSKGYSDPGSTVNATLHCGHGAANKLKDASEAKKNE